MSHFKHYRNSCLSIGVCILAGLLSTVLAKGQTLQEPQRVDFCQVVAAPENYNQKPLLIDAILSPGEHSLLLYGATCVPREDYNVTTQAILPDSWNSTEAGKKLSKILRHHHNAKVELVGTFESVGGPFGPDVARFRFSISQVKSAGEATASMSSTDTLVHELGHVELPEQH